MNAPPFSSPPRAARPRFATDAQKWSALQRRDRGADGAFVFSVRTTGVYCRPSCASRPPRRENVAFHASCAQAERAGFRPCKRCQPNGPGLDARHAATIARACRILESREPVPDIVALAREIGMSTAHFQRVFRAITGVTPNAYARAHLAKSVRQKLSQSGRVTDAIYAAGYQSNARFYADAAVTLGMKPKAFQRGGRGEIIRFAFGRCSLGLVLAASAMNGICAILLGDDRGKLADDLRRQFPAAQLVPGDRNFDRTVTAVVALIDNPRAGIHLPLDLRGTLFQQKVWRALAAIPPGQTMTYAEIARRLGQPRAARAVGSACAANNVAVAIPCHRVVCTNGSLSGYRWNATRKRALLQREAVC